MSFRLFSVEVPGSVEDSVWFIVAETSWHAADIYIAAVAGDQISVDSGEMDEAGRLLVTEFGAAEGCPRWIDWFGPDAIRTPPPPLSSCEISLSTHLAWQAFRRSEGFTL
jgi:hypothetical protein